MIDNKSQNSKQFLPESIGRKLLKQEEALEKKIDGRLAAVMIPLYLKQNELNVVLIKRPDQMRSHPGEISFPGGKFEEQLDDSLLAAALRESHEEIGLSPDKVEVLGAITPLPTYTGFAVYPFVGLIKAETTKNWQPNSNEVDSVIEIPLSRVQAGMTKRKVPESIMPLATLVYEVDQHNIWGATAWMLRELLQRLGYEQQHLQEAAGA